jgi:uncharacterized protein (DUF2132 family)
VPSWINQYGPWFAVVFLLILFSDKVAESMQKVLAVFSPGVAEKLRHAKETAQWRREQIEREYVDTVKSQKDFILEMKSQAQEERDRADKQRLDWQQRADERDRLYREERDHLQVKIERLMEQRTDDYERLGRQFAELETRNIDMNRQQIELLGMQTRRLDLISLTLASEKGFPSRQMLPVKDGE